MKDDITDSLVRETPDRLISFLNKIIIFCVRILAVLLVFVIMWGVFDVFLHLYENYKEIQFGSFDVQNLLDILGTFLAVLIAIEIFLNVIFYLKKDAIHVPLVISTALTAVARKVIIFDYNHVPPLTIFAVGFVIVCLGFTYWLCGKRRVV